MALAGLTATVAFLLVTMTIGSNVLSLSLRKALDESVKANADARQANNDLEKTTAEVKETNLKLEKANANANAQLWQSYLSHARASRMTRKPGQRFESLRAIDKALRLPLPPNRSLDELRTEAIAALCLPDLETATEWDQVSEGCTAFAIDPAFERHMPGATRPATCSSAVSRTTRICSIFPAAPALPSMPVWSGARMAGSCTNCVRGCKQAVPARVAARWPAAGRRSER